MGYKEDFISIYQEHISREGSKELLEWLQTTDFFTAPASTKFHCACTGGLVQHSVKVYQVMMEKHFEEGADNPESFAVCALLHDLCKAQFYKCSTRNVKKSVFLIERFMRLKTSEAMAIRWHMGGFDDTAKSGGYAISNAFDKYPIAVKLHFADLDSTYLREKGTSSVNRR